jgi:regulator of sigma E protease
MEGILIQWSQLILALLILVGLHEAGHMISAKLFGMRVEKFSIGFSPTIWSFKKGETEYALGAIPFGGFVKISGMVDESLDVESLKAAPQPWEFRSKPAWQRLIVMLGGIIVNVITGVLIFILITYFNGQKITPMSEVNKNGIVAYGLGNEVGFKTGDKILKVNDRAILQFSEIMSMDVLLEDNPHYTIEREGKVIDIKLPQNFINKLAKNSKKKDPEQFIDQAIPFEVKGLEKGGGAEKAGIKDGDRIIDVAANKISFFHELQAVLKQNKNKEVAVKVDRNGEIQDLQVKINKEGRMGIGIKSTLKDSVIYFSFGESVVKGFKEAFGFIFMQNKVFGKIFSGEIDARNSVGSIFSIANMFPPFWNTSFFFMLTATLSMILAFMNFLPIPALDGGHVMFLLWEMITGKKPGDKFLETAQKIGMVLLLSLMLFALSNDVMNFNWVKDLFGIKD